MPKFDKLPAYFEELKLKEEVAFTLSDLIAQLKQQIPVNFVYLTIEERNYQCSTTGWKEPVCERYGFTYENRWIQLDVPHSLLEKLNLKKEEDLPSSFYLAPHLLKKEVETTQGGITLQAGEIIIVNPHKIIMKDQEIQTEPTTEEVKKIKKLSEELETQKQNYLNLERVKNGEIAELRAKIQELETKLQQEALTDLEKEFLKDINKLRELSSNIDLNNLPPIWNKIKNQAPIGTPPWTSKLLNFVYCLYYRMNEVELEHQKVNTLTQQLKNIQDIDAQVYDILSQGANETELLPRVQAVIKELNKTRQELANANKQVSVWTVNYNTANSQLSLWTSTFPKESASQVQTRINNLTYQLSSANTQVSSLTSNYNNANNRANNLQTQLNAANTELAKEKGWWDEWINDGRTFLSITGNNLNIFSPAGTTNFYRYEDLSKYPVQRAFKEFIRTYILHQVKYSLDNKS